MPPSITTGLLVLRDMFKLLSNTGYLFYWSRVHLFWNNNEVIIEANERLLKHVEWLLEDASIPSKATTRLAYNVTIRTFVVEWKAKGVLVCLEMYWGKNIVLELCEGEVVVTQPMMWYEKVFALNKDYACQSIYKVYTNEIHRIMKSNRINEWRSSGSLAKTFVRM